MYCLVRFFVVVFLLRVCFSLSWSFLSFFFLLVCLLGYDQTVEGIEVRHFDLRKVQCY